MAKPTNIRVKDVKVAFADYRYRCPIKFGGRALDRVTILNVLVEAENARGAPAKGFGSMPLGNVWAFPSARLSYDDTLGAMRTLARRIAGFAAEAAGGEFLHPIDCGFALEETALHEASRVAEELKLAEPMPKLAALVVLSPFDAAIHDAFGKAAGINSYDGCGAAFMDYDLARYLDGAFSGEYPDRYTLRRPKATLPLYHLVGALDALTDADVKTPVGDGLPETLQDWIAADGLTHLKVKLNGDDLDWDVSRVLSVNRVAEDADTRLGPRPWRFSLDFNERCRDVRYLMEFMERVKDSSPRAFERVEYIEQPTARDLGANPENRMHAAARLKPVVIDESLVDYESLLLAREMGYSGVALKACKGQSQSLVLAAAAQKLGLFLCVQDLTCVGASYLHSVSLASRVRTVAAVEGNGRQYCPSANRGWDALFPAAFKVRGGLVETGGLTGPGLACVPPGLEEKAFAGLA